jgi:hypothetical protein
MISLRAIWSAIERITCVARHCPVFHGPIGHDYSPLSEFLKKMTIKSGKRLMRAFQIVISILFWILPIMGWISWQVFFVIIFLDSLSWFFGSAYFALQKKELGVKIFEEVERVTEYFGVEPKHLSESYERRENGIGQRPPDQYIHYPKANA